MGNLLHIDDLVMVFLNQQYYYNPWDGRKEIPLFSREQMIRALNLEGFTETYAQHLKKEGVRAIRSFIGVYVGGELGTLNFEPLFDIYHPESEYFIIRKDQIKSMSRINHERVDWKSI